LPLSVKLLMPTRERPSRAIETSAEDTEVPAPPTLKVKFSRKLWPVVPSP
jgi:hypothetical protein